MKHGPNTTGGIINYISTPIPENQSLIYGLHTENITNELLMLFLEERQISWEN